MVLMNKMAGVDGVWDYGGHSRRRMLCALEEASRKHCMGQFHDIYCRSLMTLKAELHKNAREDWVLCRSLRILYM